MYSYSYSYSSFSSSCSCCCPAAATTFGANTSASTACLLFCLFLLACKQRLGLRGCCEGWESQQQREKAENKTNIYKFKDRMSTQAASLTKQDKSLYVSRGSSLSLYQQQQQQQQQQQTTNNKQQTTNNNIQQQTTTNNNKQQLATTNHNNNNNNNNNNQQPTTNN